MRPLIIASAAFALTPWVANAQESIQITPPPAPQVTVADFSEPEVTLDTLLERALQNSPRLQIARENLSAATQRLRAARAFPNPILQMTPGFSGSREARDEEVILAQPLDVFGLRRARAQVSAAEERHAQAENSLALRTLTIEIKTAAALLYAAQENEKLELAQVEVARLFLEAATKRAALGDVPQVQVQRAQLEWLRVQNDLARAQATRLTRRATLNTLTGTTADAPLRVTLPQETVTSPLSSGTRPDILSAQATLEARQAQARELKRATLPSIELQARRSAFFGREGSTALRAVVTVPLFDFGANRSQRHAVEASARAQSATVQLLNQQAATQIENAKTQLASHRESVERYRDQLVPLTLDLLRKTQIGYAQGASTYLEVLEAQRTLRQIQTEYSQALIGVFNSETALDAALNGGVLSPEIPSLQSREVTFNESQ